MENKISSDVSATSSHEPTNQELMGAIRKLNARIKILETQATSKTLRTGQSSRIPVFAIIIAIGAVLLTAYPMIVHTLRTPAHMTSAQLPGKPLESYNFSTPSAALKSLLQIRIDQDIRSMLEYSGKPESRKSQELLDTLQIHKELTVQGKKGLFVAYETDGVPTYDVLWFEKDADSGLWYEGYVNIYSMDNETQKDLIKKWKSTGQLD
jgi:hypothetical protein